MFGRPTRSYAQVEHDVGGVSSVAAAPYSLRKEGSFRTYRARTSIIPSHRFVPRTDQLTKAALSEHSRRIDPVHIPHALQSRHARKQAAAEGARAELDQILESGYRPSSRSIHNGADEAGPPESAGMSRHRTAGGLQGESSRMGRLRSTASIGSFRGNGGSSTGYTNGGAGGGKKGVFIDADGRTHDQEYDPFAKHAAESRKKSMSSRRRSGFGSTHGHINGNGNGQLDGDTGSETSGSGSEVSEGAASGRYSAGTGMGQGLGPARKSIDSSRAGAADREEEEIRRRLALERKRLEGLSGYNALAKRRSIISDRSAHAYASNEDADRQTVHSAYGASTHGPYSSGVGGYGRRGTGYNPSPLSPTFSAASQGTGRARTNTTSDGGDETPVKSTENTLMPPMSPPQPPSPGLSAYGIPNMARRGSADRTDKVHPSSASSTHIHPNPAYNAKSRLQPADSTALDPAAVIAPKAKVEIKRDGSRKVTGFDAPRSPMPPPPVPPIPSVPNQQLDIPPSAKSAVSRGSRGSSDRDPREVGDDQSIHSANTGTGTAAARYRRERPAPRPREEIFPETPAQAKRREEKEKRAAARLGPTPAAASSTIIRSSSGLAAPSAAQAYASSSSAGGLAARNHSQLAVDTSLAASTRLLPEIQIVEDDDPRVVFPSSGGRSTRVQTAHDHVIRGPFSHALNAQGLGASAGGAGGSRRGSAAGVGVGSPTGSRQGSRAGSPGPSMSLNMQGAAGGSRKPSSVNSPFSVGSGTVEDRIGYLPSRWASGDKQLRQTEEERDMYRPKEWGGRNGELGGRQDDWQYVYIHLLSIRSLLRARHVQRSRMGL